MFRQSMRAAVWALLAMALASAGPAPAATEFDISANLRTRYEADDRSFVENVDVEHTIFQQSRARLDITHENGAQGVVEIQDSRVWGDEGDTTTDTENVDLRQGYLHFTPWDIAGVDAGRQVLAYARERVIGDNDFDNVGRSFDALKVRADFETAWLDFLFGKVSDDSETGVDENLVGTILNLDFEASGVQLQPLLLYKENTAATQYLTAFGTYAHWGQDRFWVDGDAVYQTGEIVGEDISAHLVAIDLGADFSADADQTTGVSAGFALYSGEEAGDDEFSAYDHLYADNHAYYGIMDLADTVADGLGLGLRDFHVKGWIGLAQGVKLAVGGNLFMTDVEVDLGSGADGNDLGKEVDVVIKGDLADGVALEAGGGYFLAGDLIEASIDEENATWGYVQATGTF